MDPVTAYQVTSMLESVVKSGTARAALKLERPIAGKTGTTNEYRSAWFVGYSPQLVTGVFVGFDDNQPLGNGETGGHAALPVFIDFMAEALKDPARRIRSSRPRSPRSSRCAATARPSSRAPSPSAARREPRSRAATVAEAGAGGHLVR
jgi:penicillin-binding protein 1A